MWVNTDPWKPPSLSLSTGVLEGVAVESESRKKWLWVMMEDNGSKTQGETGLENLLETHPSEHP